MSVSYLPESSWAPHCSRCLVVCCWRLCISGRTWGAWVSVPLGQCITPWPRAKQVVPLNSVLFSQWGWWSSLCWLSQGCVRIPWDHSCENVSKTLKKRIYELKLAAFMEIVVPERHLSFPPSCSLGLSRRQVLKGERPQLGVSER